MCLGLLSTPSSPTLLALLLPWTGDAKWPGMFQHAGAPLSTAPSTQGLVPHETQVDLVQPTSPELDPKPQPERGPKPPPRDPGVLAFLSTLTPTVRGGCALGGSEAGTGSWVSAQPAGARPSPGLRPGPPTRDLPSWAPGIRGSRLAASSSMFSSAKCTLGAQPGAPALGPGGCTQASRLRLPGPRRKETVYLEVHISEPSRKGYSDHPLGQDLPSDFYSTLTPVLTEPRPQPITGSCSQPGPRSM